MTGFLVSGDMEDNLAFITNGQLGRTTGSYFIEGGVALFEISKCSFRNVGDLVDFRQGMSAALDEPQGSTSSLGSPVGSLHDSIDLLQRN